MDKKEKKVIEQVVSLLQEMLEEEVVEAPAKTAKKPAGKAKKAEKEPEPEEEDVVIELDGEEYNLTEMTVKKIKKLADEKFEIEFDSDDKDQIIADFVEFLEDLESGEGENEEENETDPEEEESAEDIAEKYGLNDLSTDELKEILEAADLSTKGKKESLVARIVETIVDGEIELEVEGEDEIQDGEEEERDPEVVKAEEKVEKQIRKRITDGKLKQSEIKAFLKDYYDGDAKCSDCSKCSKNEQIDCYINIQKALVDDDAAVHTMEEPYVRDGENYCCGKPLEELDNKNLYCEVCGTEFEQE